MLSSDNVVLDMRMAPGKQCFLVPELRSIDQVAAFIFLNFKPSIGADHFKIDHHISHGPAYFVMQIVPALSFVGSYFTGLHQERQLVAVSCFFARVMEFWSACVTTASALLAIMAVIAGFLFVWCRSAYTRKIIAHRCISSS